jgi:hypothetical protein
VSASRHIVSTGDNAGAVAGAELRPLARAFIELARQTLREERDDQVTKEEAA